MVLHSHPEKVVPEVTTDMAGMWARTKVYLQGQQGIQEMLKQPALLPPLTST